MKTLKITKEDLNDNNEYIGKVDVSDYDGHIHIEEKLGCVIFKSINAKGMIIALAGSGIKAGWGIEAGRGIKAGWGIEAGLGIKAGWGIEAGRGIKAGWGIEAGLGIKAGWGIEAGLGIEAGRGIKAGWGIEAGLGIKAGWGIEAGLGIEAGRGIDAGSGIKAGRGIKAGLGIKAGFSISCKLTLSSGLRLFAGLCMWRLPEKNETKITCGKLVSGQVCYGELVELGLPDENDKCIVAEDDDVIELNGVKYKRIEDE